MNWITRISISILFIIEMQLLTYYKGYYGPHSSAIILLFTSLLIGILGINVSTSTKSLEVKYSTNFKTLKIIFSTLAVGIGIYAVGTLLHGTFSSYTLSKTDISRSDVIPLVMVMVERFLNGEFPYSEVSIWGYTLRPTYMPLIWIPFSLAEIFQFDYRWIPFSSLALALALVQFFIVRKTRNLLIFILLTTVPWMVWHYVVKEDPYLFSATIENLNVGYYLIFCLCLYTRKPLWIGLGIALCLLGRYSFVLWLPFLGMIYLIEDYKKMLVIVGTSAAALILIYILPFLRQDPSMFFDSLASYTIAAKDEWAPVWQAAGEKPYHLFRGIGVAGLFYDHLDGDLLSRVKALQLWHYLTSIFILVPLFIVYYKIRDNIHLPIFLIASLKIYFVFFYYFIQVPYSYLMMVPLFISLFLVILSWVHLEKKPAEEEISTIS